MSNQSPLHAMDLVADLDSVLHDEQGSAGQREQGALTALAAIAHLMGSTDVRSMELVGDEIHLEMVEHEYWACGGHDSHEYSGVLSLQTILAGGTDAWHSGVRQSARERRQGAEAARQARLQEERGQADMRAYLRVQATLAAARTGEPTSDTLPATTPIGLGGQP